MCIFCVSTTNLWAEVEWTAKNASLLAERTRKWHESRDVYSANRNISQIMNCDVSLKLPQKWSNFDCAADHHSDFYSSWKYLFQFNIGVNECEYFQWKFFFQQCYSGTRTPSATKTHITFLKSQLYYKR